MGRSLWRHAIYINESETISRPKYGTAEATVLDGVFPEIPIEFLFMDNDDIVEKIKADLLAEEANRLEKARKEKEKREQAKDLKKQAMAKLTKEERAALGLK